MGGRGYLVVILVGVAVIALSMAAFTVRETELAIKFRFGEIVRSDYEPKLRSARSAMFQNSMCTFMGVVTSMYSFPLAYAGFTRILRKRTSSVPGPSSGVSQVCSRVVFATWLK